MTLLGKLAAVLAAMFTGALWYSPALFGRAWVAAAHPEFSFDVMMKGVERMMAAQKVGRAPARAENSNALLSTCSYCCSHGQHARCNRVGQVPTGYGPAQANDGIDFQLDHHRCSL
jgi:predicted phage tail protein